MQQHGLFWFGVVSTAYIPSDGRGRPSFFTPHRHASASAMLRVLQFLIVLDDMGEKHQTLSVHILKREIFVEQTQTLCRTR